MTSEQYENAAGKNGVLISGEVILSGADLLREAAALESARIYGALCREPEKPPRVARTAGVESVGVCHEPAIDIEAARARRRKTA